MAGLFSILDIAWSGLQVTQGAIQNSANNIANAGTPGYSRTTQVVSTTSPVNGLPSGVEATSIERITDEFIQAQIVRENSSYGSIDMQQSALQRIEEIFNEQYGYGIGDSLTELYTSFSGLAADTTGSSVTRDGVVSAAENVLTTLQGADRELRDLQSTTQNTISQLVPEINDLTSRIAELNTEIQIAQVNGSPNTLLDQRDELVRQLAQKIDIDTFEVDGQVSVLVASGYSLVEGSISHDLVEIPDPTNPYDPSFTRIGFDKGSSTVDITDDIGGGELGGLLRVRDDTVPWALGELDAIAYNLVVSVNQVHATGTGLDGSVGNFFTDLPTVENAARDIAIDPNILASSDAIAAGTTVAPGDTLIAQQLADLQSTSMQLYVSGDTPGSPTGSTETLLDLTAGVVAEVGRDSAAMQKSLEQAVEMAEYLADRRDEVSGVSIDEEATLLIRLEAAYQANARVLQVIDGLLDEVLSLI